MDANNQNPNLFLDHLYKLYNRSKLWSKIYKIFEEEITTESEPRDDDEYIHDKKFRDAKSKSHKIARRLKMAPYIDIVCWGPNHVDI